MKAIKINDKIQQYNILPNVWKGYSNFRAQSNEVHEAEGFFDVKIPVHNTETQWLGEMYFDAENKVFTYEVQSIPQDVLDKRNEERLTELDKYFDPEAVKRLLRKVAEPILADEASLNEQDIEDAKMLYKQYRVGVIYDKDSSNIDEKRFVWNGDLYKVIGARHTSQADWTPDTAVSLYVKITPPGVIAPWKQPTGAHDAYQIGVKVTHNGKTWENTVKDNVWEPGVTGWNEV